MCTFSLKMICCLVLSSSPHWIAFCIIHNLSATTMWAILLNPVMRVVDRIDGCTHKHFEVPGAHEPIAAVVARSARHQDRALLLRQRLLLVALQRNKENHQVWERVTDMAQQTLTSCPGWRPWTSRHHRHQAARGRPGRRPRFRRRSNCDRPTGKHRKKLCGLTLVTKDCTKGFAQGM